MAQSAYTQANTGTTLAQAAFDSGNTTLTYAQAAFALANTDATNISNIQNVNLTQNTNITTVTTNAQAAFDSGNTTLTYAQTGFAKANAANVLAQASFDSGNTTLTYAQSGFTKANNSIQSVSGTSGRIAVTTTGNTAAVDLAAVSGLSAGTYTYPSLQVDSYGRITTISNQTPVTSFNGMTGSVTLSSANVTSALGYTPATSTFAQAAYDSGNTTLTYAQAGFSKANAANVLAQASFDFANTVNTYAYSAYSTANGKFSSSGGTISGDTTITGNLTVTGTRFYANTVSLVVEDNIITINSNVTGIPTLNAGIEVNRGSSTNTSLLWNETDKSWEFTNDGTNYNKIASSDYANSAYSLANTNSTNITTIQGVNSTQNTNITTATNIGQAAYDQANTSASAITVIQNVNTTQNTNITAVTNNAIAAYSQANTGTTLAQAAFDSGNTTLTYAQAGFTKANNALANTTGTFSGTLTLTGNLNTPAVNVGSSVQLTSNVFTTASTSQVTIDSYDATVYRSAKYLVQLKSGSNYHMVELSVIHDGTNTYLSQYGEIFTSSSLGTFATNISGGILSLKLTATNNITTVNLVRTSLVA